MKTSHELSRRSLLQSATALSTAGAAFAQTRGRHVAVVGAGAFGGWTALHLRRRGFDVTLLDAWGPGNARASSAGGESRVIRGSYGAKPIYTQMVARALVLWRENQAKWNSQLLHEIGALFMAPKEDEAQRASMKALGDAGLRFDHLTGAEARKRFPQINFEGRDSMVYEKQAGYLTSRRACEVVMEGFVKEGGHYKGLSVKPGAIHQKQMQGLALSDGSTLRADLYVFACGPWLGKLFPVEIGDRVLPARQIGLFFGLPAGAEALQESKCPVWLDAGSYYGIPGNNFRGIKIVGHTLSDDYDPLHPWDPSTSERVAPPDRFQAPREYLAFRFPAMKGAPLVESFVCQYEMSPDENYILDRHPGCENAWIAGGGSGHAFKLSPTVGEMMADLVEGKKSPLPFFSLARFGKKPA
jgi:glycine/D-amino acid oxidase-like deaminating enzyme